MIIYSTKYALTAGIKEHEAKDCGDGMVRIGPLQWLHGEGKEWHRDMNSARMRAQEMRINKIKSLQKQIARLQEMKF